MCVCVCMFVSISLFLTLVSFLISSWLTNTMQYKRVTRNNKQNTQLDTQCKICVPGQFSPPCQYVFSPSKPSIPHLAPAISQANFSACSVLCSLYRL